MREVANLVQPKVQRPVVEQVVEQHLTVRGGGHWLVPALALVVDAAPQDLALGRQRTPADDP